MQVLMASQQRDFAGVCRAGSSGNLAAAAAAESALLAPRSSADGDAAAAAATTSSGVSSSRGYSEEALLRLLQGRGAEGVGSEERGAEAEDLREQLLPLVVGLRRTGRLPAALAAFRDAAAAKARSFIRCAPAAPALLCSACCLQACGMGQARSPLL
jgi:hypothetical protein